MNTSISALTSSMAKTGSTTSGSVNTADPTQDRFLKLLVAQMKNQDPLNPLDNAQVTSQLAQISTVQGIDKLNTSVESMLTQFQGSQAISLPGRQVLVDGNRMALVKANDGLSARGGFSLSQDAERVTVDIKDEKGVIIKQLDLGAQSAGPGAFSWDGALDQGTAPAGKYTIEVKAYNGTTAVPVTTLMAARVEGTATTPQGVRLSLEGLGTRYYSDIRMVI